MLDWFFLILAGCIEVPGALNLKFSEGFTKLKNTILVFVCMGLSLFLLSLSLRSIPIGTAYAIWSGMGAAGTAIYGMLFFNESKALVRIFCILLIIFGAVGLKLFAAS